MNQATIIGNVTAEPEIKETPNGHKVASFSMATNRKWKDAAGVKQEEVDYHNIVCWLGLTDIVERFVGKGKKVMIQGRMKTRSWEDTNGVKRYKTEVIADTMELLGGPQKNAEHDQGDAIDDVQVPPTPAKRTKKVGDESISIEDIPF